MHIYLKLLRYKLFTLIILIIETLRFHRDTFKFYTYTCNCTVVIIVSLKPIGQFQQSKSTIRTNRY